MEDRWVEFPIEIDPVSLTQRILSVRGQISSEFVQDLDIVISANEQILDSYFENIKRDNNPSSSPEELASSFDRTTSAILSSKMESQVVASSPFRKGNFDLLYNLCTQASVHELLRELQDTGSSKEVSYCFLKEFYVDRVEEFFDGDQPYGRADDFIEELLLTPPAVKDMGLSRRGNSIVGLIDPLALAEQIISRRSQVASDWKQSMHQTASDHMLIQRALLDKIMGKSFDNSQKNSMDNGQGGGNGDGNPPSFS